MDIQDFLVNLFKEKPAGPFLFIGSGFSRRYLGLEDWKGLLTRFCVTGKPFEYYLASANGSYPVSARLIADDFNENWWQADAYKGSVEKNKAKIRDSTSALRIEICNYLATLDQSVALNSEYADEVALLSELNVDGIITTNWDLFLEQIFPDYKVYVGQQELLFSNPQEIAEIYKIHGSCISPSSLVLTDIDYRGFNDRNAYLASKLITIFVEHPVIFIGYSISDENISSMLRSISLCIGSQNVEKLRRNLIFVQRLKPGEAESISDTYLTIDGAQIPLVMVSTDDLAKVYRAIDRTKRKIPARVLRFCKEQLYQLVKSSTPEEKLCVVDIDEMDKSGDVEFLVGVGVASAERAAIAEHGYAPIEIKDLICDLLHDDKAYDARQVLEHAIKIAGRNTKNIPIFKYLRAAGINTMDEYTKSALPLNKWVLRDLKDYRSTKTYAGPFFRNHRQKSIDELIATCTPENASAFIPFLSRDKINLDILRKFLIDNESKIDPATSNYYSSYRKLSSFYDRLKYGFG